MNINYERLKKEVVNSLTGMGYKVKIYNNDGDGPLSASKEARYIHINDIGLMLKVPDDNYSDDNRLIIYKGTSTEIDTFRKLLKRIKNVSTKNGISVDIRAFNKPVIQPKDLSGEIKSRKEVSESNTSFPHLLQFLKN